MTLPPSDSPDWTGVRGGLRYLGNIALAGIGLHNGTLDFTPASYDGAVYLVCLGDVVNGGHLDAVSVKELASGLVTFGPAGMTGGDDPSVAFVARVLGSAWRVTAQVTWPGVGGPYAATLYVFAVPNYPGVSLNKPINPFPVTVSGFTASYASVIQDSSRAALGQSAQSIVPAAGTRAAVTFAGVALQTWILDSFSCRIMGRATADIQTARVTLAGAAALQHRMSVTATLGDKDEWTMGPGLGLAAPLGQALVVEFAAAPAAANFETVNAIAFAR